MNKDIIISYSIADFTQMYLKQNCFTSFQLFYRNSKEIKLLHVRSSFEKKPSDCDEFDRINL